MTRPWRSLDRAETADGVLELRQRGPGDFLISVDGRVLMTSAAHRSESALAEIACARVSDRPDARVLIGGLGMGFTLRAALDALPPGATVSVAELEPIVAEWCRGPLAPLTEAAIADPRVELHIEDVGRAIARAAEGGGAPFHAIALDLFVGPHAARRGGDDPLYGAAGLSRAARALNPGGVLAVWSEEPDRAFEKRLARAGFSVERSRPGRGGRRHVVYVAGRARRG